MSNNKNVTENLPKPALNIVDLPAGAYRPALSKPVPQRWPVLLLQDLKKLFHKAGVSFPRGILALATEWRDKNKHLL